MNDIQNALQSLKATTPVINYLQASTTEEDVQNKISELRTLITDAECSLIAQLPKS